MCCPGHHDPVSHLDELRQELTGRGWITKLLDPEGRRPALFVQNPDPQTVRFVMKAPGTWVMNAYAQIPIMKASEARDKDRLATNPTGTGPFYISERLGRKLEKTAVPPGAPAPIHGGAGEDSPGEHP